MTDIMHILRSAIAGMDRRPPRSASRASGNMPVRQFILADTHFEGGVVGEFAGKPIRERVVDGNGLSYHYCGPAPRDCDGRLDIRSLRPDEWIVRPGLVYAMDVEGAPDLTG